MRGKDSIADRRELIERITPAYAGKSHFALPNKVCIWDHPRLCGEKDRCGNCRNGDVGSPPPMRGKVTNNAVCWQLFRITPAYAGKSGGNVMSQMAYTDHPRLCGEKLESDAILGENAGSPPPMRGKVQFHMKNLSAIGDHPRLCGEKQEMASFFADSMGSPPPMRGKGSRLLPGARSNRITPAYAGKSH